jgi:hypothetical protein
MSSKREVTPETLPAIVWREANVITTELLAALYGANVTSIQKNYERNLGRFEEGKHFFKLQGEALRELKAQTDSKSVSRNTRSLILWTERGAARHAKMLETDQAWDVFEKLEDCYFSRRGGESEDDNELSTVKDRTPLYHGAVEIVLVHRLSFGNAYQALNYFAGSRRFPEMTKRQVAETSGFLRRLLTGEATQKDFQRINQNQAAIAGPSAQMTLGLTIPLVLNTRFPDN